MPTANSFKGGQNKIKQAKVSHISKQNKAVKKARRAKGLRIERFFTQKGKNPLDQISYELRSCSITNPDGSVVFEMNDIEVPKNWSKVASDILISKYIRKKGVPQLDRFGNTIKDKDGKVKLGAEKSVKQVISRIVGCWRHWGEKYKYFYSKKDAQAFEDELKFMLVNQYGAPNSPQWFNTGLAYAYDIKGTPQGHWYADPKTGRLKQSEDAYTHPQPHACFIQSIRDDLVNEGGIYDLMTREARIFKYGSGSGTNFSSIRAEGEPLSGGGKSSGLMSWLKILDRSAGAIKSGGTTRRASKMVILNADHPDVEEFVEWKYKEEQKAAALIASGYTAGLEGEAYNSVSGQNSNNSVRVNDEFMKAVENDDNWDLTYRVEPGKVMKTIKARELWDKIANAAWHCGDPGLQFDTTTNNWHTCLSSGRINGSNPCSEFMFIDDSACNLASLNLTKFIDTKTNDFDVEAFRHATRLWTVVLEISVLMAQFPSYEIAKNSYLFRPLGLGYANLGALLMQWGIPYDSDKGRSIAGAITALMTGESYATSAEIAKHLGPFKEYEKNKKDMLRVIRNHRRTINLAPDNEFEDLNIAPQKINESLVPLNILQAARESWDKALLEGGQYGFRNAQVTLLAPTGTIGLLMDCDTTGVEPDYALVKFKKLAGGGYFKIINQSVPKGLKKIGYTDKQIDDIISYIVGTGTLENAPHINREELIKKGMSQQDIDKAESLLSGAFELNQAFQNTKLTELGFSLEQIQEASDYICGKLTIEGAPHLKDEHLPIFDCASKCGQYGKRYIEPMGHIKMMGVIQPFLSGAISKTVNMSNEASMDEISEIYRKAWEYGLKAIAIYRDGSKLAQPLNTKSDSNKTGEGKQQKEIIIEYRPVRKRLAKQRTSITRKVTIGGHKMFLTVGLYDDGKPGELFIIMNQQGSFAAGMADSFAKMVSIGLQYGVPIETIVSQLRHMRFQPMGFTGDSDIPNASSISDFIAQWFDKMFLGDGLKAMHLPFEDNNNSNTKPENSIAEMSNISEEDDKTDINLSKNLFTESLGFSGEMCPECGMASMVQNGKCLKCMNCGATTGCS